VSWVTVGLERVNQSAQSRRKDDQITGIGSGGISMGDPRRYEYRHSRADSFGSVGVPKSQFAIEDMPRFIVGMVQVKGGRTAAAPFMDPKRGASRGKTRGLHATILLRVAGIFCQPRAAKTERQIDQLAVTQSSIDGRPASARD
jgi:hypothetical protein